MGSRKPEIGGGPLLVTECERSGPESEDDETGEGFRVDGYITRRVTKLFPPDDEIWTYNEVSRSQDEYRSKGDVTN